MHEHRVGDLLLALDKKTLGVIVRMVPSPKYGTLYAVDWDRCGYGFPYYERDINEWKELLCRNTK